MARTELLKSLGCRLSRFSRCGALLLAFVGAAHFVSAQSAASSTAPAPPSDVATGSAGVTAGAMTGEAKPASPNLATPAQPGNSPHLVAKTGPPEEEANRKALEENAGKDAANLLMRSSPSGAQIFVNGAFVGRTPLLLNVAPGKYKVEMRGDHDDSAERTIGLLPHDTQKITMTLGSRYPNRVSIK